MTAAVLFVFIVIVVALVFELVNGFHDVAKTIGQGLVDTHFITMSTILCGLLGGIIWNLLTWWLGLPSSSSHALMGGLCGAALSRAFGHWNVLSWSLPADPW